MQTMLVFKQEYDNSHKDIRDFNLVQLNYLYLQMREDYSTIL